MYNVLRQGAILHARASESKIILHHFHVDNNEGESHIGYDMIISRNRMVKLGHLADFKRHAIQWDCDTVTTKEPSGLLGKTYLTIREMCEVVMQTTEPVSTKDATKSLVETINITYAKEELEQVAPNATQMND